MKPIKAFAPFNLSTPDLYKWCGRAAKSDKTAEVIGHFLARDPASQSWDSMGLIAPFEEGRIVHSLDGAAYLLAYQFNQRILPGAVRDEKLKERLADLVEREGRDATKQEYAQLRDQVEDELLPQAFIRRTVVPVLVYKKRIIIGNTSAKKHADITYHLSQLMVAREIDCEIHLIFTEDDAAVVLKKLALEGDLPTDMGRYFHTADAAVFKGGDKRTMRIKDRAISHAEVQHALVDGAYGVTELRVEYMSEDDDKLITCTITDKLMVKGIKLAESLELESAEDAHATYFLYAKQLDALTDDMIDIMGGEAVNETEDEL